MRLYLSSFRIGDHPDRLLALAGGGRRAAVVANAMDAAPADVRAAAVRLEVDALTALGFDVSEIDLRRPKAPERLATVDVLWVRGGNTFVLRGALADSGADATLVDLVEAEAVVYAGYSAGPCVLAPDIAALAHVDDVSEVADPILTGLGLLDRPFVPHVDSPGHGESALCDEVAATYAASGQPHWALRDGEVLLVDGPLVELLSSSR